MRFHTVQVDEEVFKYIKNHAEPLVDDFNSTLRRLFGLDSISRKSNSVRSGDQVDTVPGMSLPRDVPQALRQVLEVAFLVRRQGETRKDATRDVASMHNVAPQTVLDKYCRQLTLTANEFDRLLEQSGVGDLREKLFQRFPEYKDTIEEILLKG